LTEAVTQTPHAVLLLDEIEKAHPDVYNLLLQIMDHGKLTDANGRSADFRNVILVMTTNAGAALMNRRGIGFTEYRSQSRRHGSDPASVHPGVPQPSGCDHPVPLTAFEIILKVVDKFLMELENQLADKGVTLEVSKPMRDWLAEHGFDEQMGARPMKRVIQDSIKRPLADELLFGQLSESGGTVSVDLDEAGKGLVCWRLRLPGKSVVATTPET
jgi:ATP-dependent Clp protease ATP-binding subunit ClpA